MGRSIIFFFSLMIIFSFSALSAMAIDIESSRFRIEKGNINFLPGSKGKRNVLYPLLTREGKTSWDLFQKQGYLVKKRKESGETDAFTTSLSKSIMEFAPSSEVQFQRTSSDFSFSCQNGVSFQVFVQEEYPLRTLSGRTITDTRCDDPDNPCTPKAAKPWKDKGESGFGYRVEGAGAPFDFSRSSSYRPFPNQNKGERPTLMLSRFSCTTHSSAKLTLQLAADTENLNLSFENSIYLLTVPSF